MEVDMRLYLFGLLSGLLVAGLVGIVACGPIDGGGDGGNGPGVKVGALTTKTIDVDCSSLVDLYGGIKGVELKGISFNDVVSFSTLSEAGEGFSSLATRALYRSPDGKAYVTCSGGEKNYKAIVLIK